MCVVVLQVTFIMRVKENGGMVEIGPVSLNPGSQNQHWINLCPPILSRVMRITEAYQRPSVESFLLVLFELIRKFWGDPW